MIFVIGRTILLIPMVFIVAADTWIRCDITQPPFNAVGYNHKNGNNKSHYRDNDYNTIEKQHTNIIQQALTECNEIILPKDHVFISGPFNLSSNQVLTVDGTLMASTNKDTMYPLIAPVLGYGWSNDMNCFLPNVSSHKIVIGALRYAPFIGIYYATNVTIRGSGKVDGQGQVWWTNCTKCHYDATNNNNNNEVGIDPSYCLTASRPKLIEAQFVDGLSIFGGHDYLLPTETNYFLTLTNSPFWTVTPSYSQNIYISNLKILAPVNRIGNTDGVNLDSCRDAIIRNSYISNGDDGISIKSGLNGFGLNLAIPTENVIIENITTDGRGGFAIGSEMSGGVRNITFRNSRLLGERGIYFKPSIGRGGYIEDILFQNIETSKRVAFRVGHDGIPLVTHNAYVPLVSNIRFENVQNLDLTYAFADCSKVNQSKCFNISEEGNTASPWPDALPSPRYFTCKTTAHTMLNGTIRLPWPVCIPLDAPVNILPGYYNWGPTFGQFSSLSHCQKECNGHFRNNMNNNVQQNFR
jgi:polygalacturonase